MQKQIFTVTSSHLKLLKSMYVGWNSCEFGAPSVDCKRPFGSSGYTSIMLEMAYIVGMLPEKPDQNDFDDIDDVLSDAQQEQLLKLYQELETCLQILLKNLSIEEGVYTADDYKINWAKSD